MNHRVKRCCIICPYWRTLLQKQKKPTCSSTAARGWWWGGSFSMLNTHKWLLKITNAVFPKQAFGKNRLVWTPCKDDERFVLQQKKSNIHKRGTYASSQVDHSPTVALRKRVVLWLPLVSIPIPRSQRVRSIFDNCFETLSHSYNKQVRFISLQARRIAPLCFVNDWTCCFVCLYLFV